LFALWRPFQPYDYILIQNPPCVPLLFICVLVRVLTCFRTRLVIDWHNYGFTIMRVNHVSNILVKVARWYELIFGRFGDFHLTVSETMKQDLLAIIPSLQPRANRVHVLYDRATSKFQAGLSMQEKCELL
jgi:beta-1,4-mannosyltransferase